VGGLSWKRKTAMNLTIDLPDDLGEALRAKALAHGVSPAAFTRHVLEEAVKLPEEKKLKPKKSGYGLLAKYGPGPSDDEIEENRREMFRGFAQDVP
jgi:plasmid stability protein